MPIPNKVNRLSCIVSTSMKYPSFSFLPLSLFALFLGSTLTVSGAAVPTVELSIGQQKEIVPIEKVSSWFHMTTSKEIILGYQSEIEDTHFCPHPYALCDFALPRQERSQVKTLLSTRVDTEKVREYLDELSTKTDVSPKDAIFKGDESGKIIVSQPEVLGLTLQKEAALSTLVTALEKTGQESVQVTLPALIAEPTIKSGDIEKLGLKELIGTGTSNFRGSPKNRIYNINRALQQFQSIIIAPGAEFSFVEYLGEVDDKHGYLPELVIKNNKTEPEFGGGICQVSSTVFRAAIYSGMKITERRNHSYAVQYYKPYGMDATIYVPKPDFKFQNNTAHSIMIQSEIIGTDLVFRFFGTKDGRQVAVDGPYILESNPDGSMRTTFTQIVKDAEGKEMIKDEFKSNYKSPSLFPHPGEEQVKLTTKPKDWSNRQWQEYKKLNP